MISDSELLLMGRVSGVFGIKGWLKVWSYADPIEGILDYPVWYLRLAQGWQKHAVVAGQVQGKGIVAQLQGCADRDSAAQFLRADIAVPLDLLLRLPASEYYWHQLAGLRVYTGSKGQERVLLGAIDHLIETGANDVLVVKPLEGSLDQRERLIPWIPEEVVLNVDLAGGELLVDWDPDY